MRSTEIVFFCAMYLLFFFMIGSLAGVAEFPPPPQTVKFDLWLTVIEWRLSIWDFALLLGVLITIVGISLTAGLKVFGSGISFDQSFVVTLCMAIFFGGVLAWTMSTMLVNVPIYVSAVLVWPFIALLMYGIITMARGSG